MQEDQKKTNAELSYKMLVSYKGTNFSGFQSQRSQQAVQDHLESALSIFLRKPTKIRGASRTDTGVHAFGQVASFRTEADFRKHSWLASFQGLLPKDIAVRDVEPSSESFHPIYSAKAKIYRYSLYLGAFPSPFVRDYIWPVAKEINLELLEKALKSYIGKHDFSSYCNADSDARSKVRNVLDIQMEQSGSFIHLWFLGEGFLKQMIRILVGTAVDVAFSRIALSDLDRILKEKKRCHAGMTAPAKGLCLQEIFYNEVLSIKEHQEKMHHSSFYFA